MTVLWQILERLVLTLNEAKTKIVNAYEGGKPKNGQARAT
jgi:hypothetical protein